VDLQPVIESPTGFQVAVVFRRCRVVTQVLYLLSTTQTVRRSGLVDRPRPPAVPCLWNCCLRGISFWV